MKCTTKVRAPNNFYWKIVIQSNTYSNKGYVEVQLRHKSNHLKIGEVRLHMQSDGVYETHSDLLDKHHNKGYGTLLYARAIQWCMSQKRNVRSSGNSSEAAQRVWRGKSIRKYFKIITKPYDWGDDSIAYPDYDVFYAYPKRRK